ncbi:complement C1q-like protein 2 [Ostrea edulis]|uniref:complement C1q-like protein 2 n=1 Tax=Ostrea edulis TaxID=37623 RepID=UPI0024AED3B7|nr:complement C1q-like protein 2 [Ostrea edulis]
MKSSVLLSVVLLVAFLVTVSECQKDEEPEVGDLEALSSETNVLSKRHIFHLFPKRQSFYVRLSRPQTNLGKNDIICFDNVVSDRQHLYNTRTGKFVCPRSGHYVFTWTLMTHHKRWVVSDLVVGGEVKGKLTVDSDEHYESGSTTVVVYVRRGATVYVRNIGGDGKIEAEVSSFAGWRLSKK